MTENMAKKIGLGLLVLGLLGTYPLSSYADNLQELRKTAAEKGLDPSKVSEYTAKDKWNNIKEQHNSRFKGATQAAAARYKKAGGGLSGAWAAVTGATSDGWKDLTGQQSEIASDLKGNKKVYKLDTT